MWSVPRRVEPWMSHTNQVVKLEWSTTFKTTFRITDPLAGTTQKSPILLPKNSNYKCYSSKLSSSWWTPYLGCILGPNSLEKDPKFVYIPRSHLTLVHIRERGFYLFPRPLLSKPSLAFVIVTCRISFTKKDLTVRPGRPAIWLLTIFRLNVLSFVSSWTAKSQPVGVITFVLGVTSWAKQKSCYFEKVRQFLVSEKNCTYKCYGTAVTYGTGRLYSTWFTKQWLNLCAALQKGTTKITAVIWTGCHNK